MLTLWVTLEPTVICNPSPNDDTRCHTSLLGNTHHFKSAAEMLVHVNVQFKEPSNLEESPGTQFNAGFGESAFSRRRYIPGTFR